MTFESASTNVLAMFKPILEQNGSGNLRESGLELSRFFRSLPNTGASNSHICSSKDPKKESERKYSDDGLMYCDGNDGTHDSRIAASRIGFEERVFDSEPQGTVLSPRLKRLMTTTLKFLNSLYFLGSLPIALANLVRGAPEELPTHTASTSRDDWVFFGLGLLIFVVVELYIWKCPDAKAKVTGTFMALFSYLAWYPNVSRFMARWYVYYDLSTW